MSIAVRDRVFFLVAKIPKGRVATYGQLARMADTGPRAVGTFLHQNTDPKTYPCHRVVHSDGTLAPSYVFGGGKKQLQKLRQEKVDFVGNKVNLNISLWIPT